MTMISHESDSFGDRAHTLGIKIKSMRTCVCFALSVGLTLSWYGCSRSTAPVEGPPSLPVILLVNQKPISAGSILTHVFQNPLGAQALRLELMLDILRERSQRLGSSDAPKDIDHWREILPAADQPEAELYAWASQIVKLKSSDEPSLRARFEQSFPQGMRLVGRQVDLTPPQAWTEDHYQRQLGHFRSWARLKLTQIRHQMIEGAPFAQLASEHSHHQVSAAQGGLVTLNQLSRERFSPRVIRAVNALRLGELSPIIQDHRGAYLFYREDQESSMALDGEGMFWPHSALSNDRLQRSEFWTLLHALCEKSYACKTDELLPTGSHEPRWRAAWSQYAKRSGLQKRRARGRRSTKRRRRRARKEGDARKDTGGPQSWSAISQDLLKASGATYRSHLSPETLRKLRNAGYDALFERVKLYQTLPLMITSEGVWLIRLRERSLIPALSQPRLRMLSLDLTRSGLQRKWGTWGVEQIGQRLISAARNHRLSEALRTLDIESTTIRPHHVPPKLLQRAMSASLETGAQILTDSSQKGGQPTWTLVLLEHRQKVTFADVKDELISALKSEISDDHALRLALRDTWEKLRVELSLSNQKIDLSAIHSVGFTREVNLKKNRTP